MNSLSLRVGLSSALVVTLFVFLTALALDRAFRDSAESAARERLLAQTYLLMAATELDDAARVRLPEKLGEPRFSMPESGLYAAVFNAQGESGWVSPSARGLNIPFPVGPMQADLEFTRLEGAWPAHVLRMAVSWEARDSTLPLLFVVAEDLAPYTEQIRRYRQSLWGWLGAMGVLLVLFSALALRWGLAPLRRVAREVKAIEDGEQDGLRRQYPRELEPLTQNLNTLLSHERAQQGRYRDALGDLAHSLKTPLAVLRGQLADPGLDAQWRQTADEQLRRMDDIVAYQLQRAATAGRRALSAPVALGALVGRMTATLAKVHRDRAPEVSVDIDAALELRMEEGDLMECLGNLLDNAYKWCRGRVAVAARATDSAVHIVVEDDGPGIEPAQREAILARGVRLDEQTPGHGIGMAIVRDIMTAYGGEFRIEQGALGGARMVLVFPR